MIRVAVLSFSDGRGRVHETLKQYIQDCTDTIVKALQATGEVEATMLPDIINGNELALKIPKEAVALNVDACIFNICVFSFPNFSAIARRVLDVPVLAIAPKNGAYPGLGGLQATVNIIHQAGGSCEKVWGNISEKETLNRVMAFLRAAKAVSRLKGQIFGLFGGRSIGIGSGAVNPDLWMQKFGVDVDHIDQLEIIRRAQLIDGEETRGAKAWLEDNTASIRYDEDKLTDEALEMQIKCHMALKQLIAEKSLDFVAVKCHYDLSEYYVSQCLSAALCNDPYDWDGAKKPVVFSCEADADAALTMQTLHLISGKPVLFMDFRHYLENEKVFAFCNCGACATWYAKRSDIPGENLKDVTLHPLIPKYGGKGCHVQFMAAPGQMTFARLTRSMNNYKLQAFRGEFRELPKEKMELTCPAWPHGYAKVDSDPYTLVQQFECNHIHAVAGDYIEELRRFCEMKDIDFELL